MTAAGGQAGGRVLAVACRDLTVRYGAVRALERVDVGVRPGEAVALLGPSGAGKSTLLHAVAGFVAPSAGEVELGGRVVASARASVPAERRAVGVVFQHYALWPHLSACDNVAYPLRRQGLSRAGARRRAAELLERMGIAELADRRPAELSGGQQQRVGLARALARDAEVFLFDEPTAHLDTALRAAMQAELASRRRERGAAALYATHDAGEALALADQIVLLRAGRVVQTGTPREVYEQPVDRWAALLTGPASLVGARVRAAHPGRVTLELGGVEVHAATGPGPAGDGAGARGPAGTAAGPPAAAPRPGEVRDVLVRPDWAELGGPVPAKVEAVSYRGPHTDYRLDTPAGPVDVRRPGPPAAAPGEPVGVGLRRVWVVPRPGAP